MIEIKNGTKTFGKLTALNKVTCRIENGSIFGIVGSNGAGKSTLLRVISGVYKLDEGQVLMDNEDIYNNRETKKDIIYLSDTPSKSFGMTLRKLMNEYSNYYKKMDIHEYQSLLKIFKLDEDMPLSGFSKGMLRQAMIIIALSCNTQCIVLDETLDGLDAMVRGLVKKKIYKKVIDCNTTVIISSHSLRELEDFCDSLILIHQGNLIFEKQLQDMDTSIVKVQIALKEDRKNDLLNIVDIVKYQKSGSVANLLVRGNEQDIITKMQKLNPVLLEVIPLSLEEIFTYELQELGYAIDIEEESALSLEDK